MKDENQVLPYAFIHRSPNTTLNSTPVLQQFFRVIRAYEWAALGPVSSAVIPSRRIFEMTNGSTTNPTWMQGLASSLKTQTATWLVAFLLGILGLFSGQITESVKFALNRADLRTTQYDELATEISQYIFSAELNTELIGSSSTTKDTLKKVVGEYNTYILTLRKKEFVYAAWIQKYWGDSQELKFKVLMQSIRQFDNALHSINDELGKIANRKKETIDPERAKEAMVLMQPAVKKLREDGYALLISLN